MYRKMICITLTAWFIELMADANIGLEPIGFLCLRILFPMLVMKYSILYTIQKKNKVIIKS